jgi:hypothetical protein
MRAPHRRALISPRKPRLRSWLAAALLLIGCQVISGVDDLTIVPGSSSGAGASGADPGQMGAAAASGEPGVGGGMSTGNEDCGPDGTQTCPDNQLCRSGVCIEPLEDKDGDGTPAGSDCDDNDKNVTITARRACDSACASGNEQCVMGAWGECDAPTDCSCTPGEDRQIKCGMCGMQTQHCGPKGQWADMGTCSGEGVCGPGGKEDRGACGLCGKATRTCLETCQWDMDLCTGEGECTAGDSESEPQSCGVCGTEKTRSRSCSTSCAWDAWSDWGACSKVPGCSPNTQDTDSQGCGNCASGMQTRNRSCGTDCSWGGWGTWGGCSGATGCNPTTAPEQQDAPCGNCDLGSRSRLRSCNSSCAWTLWGAWGGCTNGGVCAATDAPQNGTQMCGNCNQGTQTHSRTCAATCTWNNWGGWGMCSGAGACKPTDPAQTDTQSCGQCLGTQNRTRGCGSACAWNTWGAWGGCSGAGACKPGDPPQTQACGNCGTQSRTCDTASCTWNAYGACTGQGVCAPTATDTTSRFCSVLGNNYWCPLDATQPGSRTCAADCTWGAWGWGACNGDEICSGSGGCCPCNPSCE